MVRLVCGLHYVSSNGDEGKFRSGGASPWASPRGSKDVEQEVGLYHGCLGSYHRSFRVVKLG